MDHPRYSIIIPVYNRPGEVRDLLDSLTQQTRKDFEVIVVEDGSSQTCEDVVRDFANTLTIRYYFKQNSGPGPSRNFGYAHARGDYFVVFDSDCILPPGYFEEVDQALLAGGFDAWGGPDRAHKKFTAAQRAMAYTMSSVFTTGGIRGGKKRVGWFQPRSFNMGISRRVYEETKGFSLDRAAEDIELSIRIKKAGFRIGLISNAYVYHRRRETFPQFFRQVFNFGKGRARVGKLHPGEVKIAHWFPSAFTGATALLPVLYLAGGYIWQVAAALLLCYLLVILVHSAWVSRHPGVALLSVISALFQLWGYGLGFLAGKLGK